MGEDIESLRAENIALKAQLALLQGTHQLHHDIGHLVPMLDAMHEGFQLFDREWRYLYVNPAAAQQGRNTPEALLGRTLLEMYPGTAETPLFAVLQRCMEERCSQSLENEFTYPDGSINWFELRIQPVPAGLLVLSIDIGERRRMQMQLSHVERMEAIGRLAAGVAHDFNNLLTVIMACGDALTENLALNDSNREHVEQIGAAAKRGAQLTRQLLNLRHPQKARPRRLHPNAELQRLVPMLSRLVGARVRVELELASEVGDILFDAGQLDQVALNLASNARDAMQPVGGRLSLHTENVWLDHTHAQRHVGVVPGAHVMIAMRDTGCGIDPKVVPQIFEPFFTTKVPERGTGLGLATCYGIVRQASGHIEVESLPGHGSTFKLYFPMH